MPRHSLTPNWHFKARLGRLMLSATGRAYTMLRQIEWCYSDLLPLSIGIWYHNWSWLITENFHVKWNIFQLTITCLLSESRHVIVTIFMIFGDLTSWFLVIIKMSSPKIIKNVSFNVTTFHDSWWFFVTFDDCPIGRGFDLQSHSDLVLQLGRKVANQSRTLNNGVPVFAGRASALQLRKSQAKLSCSPSWGLSLPFGRGNTIPS